MKAGVEYALNPSDIKFTKVGHFLFGSNEAVKFQSREFRTVNLVDVNSLYVKFLFHKCHVNKLNIFNQIGIIAVSVLGEPLGVPLGGPNGIADHGFQQLEYQMQFDEETLSKLRMLEKARDRAEKNEDYAEAKKFNEAISELKRIGVNLQKLEERKAIAVRNKDYDSAEILKKVLPAQQEINSLRRAKIADNIPSLDPLSFGGPAHPESFGGDRGLPRNDPSKAASSFGAMRGEQRQPGGPSTAEFGKEKDDGRTPVDRMRRNRPDSEAGNDFSGNGSGSHQKTFGREGRDDSLNQFPGGPGSRAQVQPGINPDSIVIPAARKNKGAMSFGQEDIGGIDEDPLGNKIDDPSVSLNNAEDIKLADMPKAEPLIPQLSEGIVRGLFSKNWNIREKAAKVIAEELKKGAKSEL